MLCQARFTHVIAHTCSCISNCRMLQIRHSWDLCWTALQRMLSSSLCEQPHSSDQRLGNPIICQHVGQSRGRAGSSLAHLSAGTSAAHASSRPVSRLELHDCKLERHALTRASACDSSHHGFRECAGPDSPAGRHTAFVASSSTLTTRCPGLHLPCHEPQTCLQVGSLVQERHSKAGPRPPSKQACNAPHPRAHSSTSGAQPPAIGCTLIIPTTPICLSLAPQRAEQLHRGCRSGAARLGTRRARLPSRQICSACCCPWWRTGTGPA